MRILIEVKIFGVARLKAGQGTFRAEAKNVDELLGMVPNLTRKEAADLVLLVNGKPVSKRYRFRDGDQVVLLSPAGGG